MTSENDWAIYREEEAVTSHTQEYFLSNLNFEKIQETVSRNISLDAYLRWNVVSESWNHIEI